MRVPPRRAATAALLLVPLLGVACGGSSGSSSATKTKAVDVLDNKFSPKSIAVSVGDTVTWTFKGSVAHNVTGPGFRSKTEKSGTFTHTFDSAGDVPYLCTIHAGMKGTITVS
jgi:plastocyanin